MNHVRRTLAAAAAIAVIFAGIASGCSTGTDDPEAGTLKSGRGEHDGDGGEHGGRGGEHGGEGGGEHGGEGGHDKEGEESGTELGLSDRHDEVRNGVRLILAYDASSNSFNGTVENTTEKTLERVRVEVHLSNGKELGPTTPADLGPGEKRPVKLTASSKDFDGWSAHPEVGSGEHGHGEQKKK